jgi:hypothetical protein
VVVEPRATNKTTSWSERSSVLKKRKKGDKKRSKQKKNELDPADIVIALGKAWRRRNRRWIGETS